MNNYSTRKLAAGRGPRIPGLRATARRGWGVAPRGVCRVGGGRGWTVAAAAPLIIDRRGRGVVTVNRSRVADGRAAPTPAGEWRAVQKTSRAGGRDVFPPYVRRRSPYKSRNYRTVPFRIRITGDSRGAHPCSYVQFRVVSLPDHSAVSMYLPPNRRHSFNISFRFTISTISTRCVQYDRF